MNQLLDFHFIRAQWLLALLPFLLMVYVASKADNYQSTWKKNLPQHLRRALNVGGKEWRKTLPIKVWGGMAIIAIIVAAGPTWKRQPAPFGEDRSPVFIVLDVSQSMLEKDLAPSRLARAKYKIQDLVDKNSTKKMALIAYAGSAHLAVPLTQDTQLFPPILNALVPAVMPRNGKYPEYALKVIEQQLNEQNEMPESATIILITDGVGSGVSDDYEKFMQRKDIALQLLVLGVGNSQRQSDIPFDMLGLKQFASATSGDYHPLSNDDTDIEWLLSCINQHIELNGDNAQPWKDMGYPLVFVVMGTFLLWFRRGWTVHWCLLPLLFATLQPLPAFATGVDSELGLTEKAQSLFWRLWVTDDQLAQWYFNQGKYLLAAETFVNSENKAQAYYLAEEFTLAYAFYQRVNTPQGMLGAANALAQQRKYVVARHLYQQILKIYPTLLGAKVNLEIVEKIIEDINRQSGSQASTENESSKELGDAPQTADGVDEIVAQQLVQQEAYNAQQLRANKAIFDAWMKKVEGNQKAFLAVKFEIQVQQWELNDEQ